jgi:ATP-dependent DNA helicase PIF1
VTFYFTKKIISSKSILCHDSKQNSGLFNYVGLYFPKTVFFHGQLYVTLSKVTSPKGLRILIIEDEEKY